jgi:putative salt-induced outer membrane protein
MGGLTMGAALAGQVSAQDPAPTPAPAPPPKPPGWERSAALGFTMTQGNSKNLLFTANILAARKWERDEVQLGADATYGESDGEKNSESIHGFGQYNRLFTERFYGFMRLDALHDDIADVEYRFTFSPGVGYYFIKRPQTTLSGEIGPGFIYEKQGGETTGYFTLRLAERFEHKFNDKTKIWQFAEIMPQVDDFDNYLLNVEAGIDTKLSEDLSLQVIAKDNYDNDPAPGRLRNDFKLIAALKYTF